MSNMIGADIAALRSFAQRATARSQEIDARIAQLQVRIEALPWTGSDREQFLAEWSVHHRSLVDLARDLADAGQRAFRHADDQEHASGGPSGGSGW